MNLRYTLIIEFKTSFLVTSKPIKERFKSMVKAKEMAKDIIDSTVEKAYIKDNINGHVTNLLN